MRLILLFAFIQFIATSTVFGQEEPFKFNEKGFSTVFSNVKSGKYVATANGVLLIEKSDGRNVILDFQGSKANLILEETEEEIYDVSWKNYTAYTTSGKTIVRYQTYSDSNNLLIDYQGEAYGLYAIDGACDMVINGLSYTYMAEKEAEYLVLIVEKELKLRNIEREGYLILQPNSTLVFAVRRT